MSFLAVLIGIAGLRKIFVTLAGDYKEIRPAQQPIKSLVLSLLYNKTIYFIEITQ